MPGMLMGAIAPGFLLAGPARNHDFGAAGGEAGLVETVFDGLHDYILGTGASIASAAGVRRSSRAGGKAGGGGLGSGAPSYGFS